MAKEHPIEIFMPPNMLKAKVGGRIAGVDMAAIKRAEQALANLKTEFEDWISTDVARLGTTRDAFAKSANDDTRGELYRAAHDLRGQALTFEYPLIARMAKSLCNLLDGADGHPPIALVDAHVDAIRVIVRQNIKAAGDKTAVMLSEELEARVREFLEKPKA
jgi:chemotaxis protein histidine kinase CheA